MNVVEFVERSCSMHAMSAVTSMSVALFCASCYRPDPDSRSVEVRDSLGIEIVQISVPRQGSNVFWRVAAEPDWDIGGSTSEPNYQFWRIVAVTRIAGGRVIVADGGELVIRAYDTDGVFRGAAGGDGEGPGEFKDISSMVVRGQDSVVVYDQRIGRLSIFDAQLSYTRSLPLGPTEGTAAVERVSSFADGSWLLEGMPLGQLGSGLADGVTDLGLVLTRFSEHGRHAQLLRQVAGAHVFVHTGNGVPNTAFPHFGESTTVAAFGNGYVIAHNDRYQLRFYDGDDRLTRIIRLDRPRRPVTENDRDAVEGARDMPFPDSMPAFGRYLFTSALPALLVDAKANVWVLQYHYPEAAPERWDVFAPSGEFRGSVLFPDAFTPFSIGENDIVGVWRDGDDVHHLRKYTLEKS